jgi:hypothetical protein
VNDTMTLLAEVEEFVGDHPPARHAGLRCDRAGLEWLPAGRACACGVVFERWVTPENAELDQLRAASLN